MKRQSPTRPPAELDPALLLDANVDDLEAETEMDTDEDEIYSDEFLDQFMAADSDDGDDDYDDYAYSRAMKLDGDDDFESYFRDSDGYSHSRRRRGKGRGRHARDSWEFEPYDRSDWRASNRRPRR